MSDAAMPDSYTNRCLSDAGNRLRPLSWKAWYSCTASTATRVYRLVALSSHPKTNPNHFSRDLVDSCLFSNMPLLRTQKDRESRNESESVGSRAAAALIPSRCASNLAMLSLICGPARLGSSPSTCSVCVWQSWRQEVTSLKGRCFKITPWITSGSKQNRLFPLRRGSLKRVGGGRSAFFRALVIPLSACVLFEWLLMLVVGDLGDHLDCGGVELGVVGWLDRKW